MNAQAILRRATGLALAPDTVERAVRTRMAQLGLGARAEYVSALAGAELDALAELVVVPESWMFRDSAAFDAALELARERIGSRPGHVLRILSLPCAGGEEPYSMAMALHAAGVPLASCRIDGIDLSAAAIARARAGRYTRNAFRSADLRFRDVYFTQDGSSHVLCDEIRNAVHFSQGNLMAPATLAAAGRYDIVFCRNLLIYFGADGIARAASALSALLADDGMLFCGPAETPVLGRHGFVSVHKAGAFALRKASATPVARTARRAPSTPAARPLRLAPPAPPSPPAPAAPGVDELLALAQRQADAGLLQEAAATCGAVLSADPGCAAAHFILGLLSECRADARAAERHWRRCVYLDPNHYEALCALALQAEQAGEHGVASVYRQRAGRVSLSREGSRAA